MATTQSLLSVLLLAATPARAQTFAFAPDPDPGTGAVNAIPLGDRGPTGAFQNLRTQIRVPASVFPIGGATITDLAVAAGSAGSYSYRLLEVRMGHLPGTDLSTSFPANLAGDVAVLSRRDMTLTFARADAWSDLGLFQSFRHDGSRPLVVDVVVQGASFSGPVAGTRRSTTLQHVFALNYAESNPNQTAYGPLDAGARLRFTLADGSFVVAGVACGPGVRPLPAISGTGSTARRGSFTVSAASLRPNTAALLLLGRSEQSYAGVPLPLDLTAVGAPGCRLYTDLLLVTVRAADAGGAVAVSLTIPDDPALAGRNFFVQWTALDAAANALGLSFTALGRGLFR
jgi:hypothetical protein